VEAESNTSTLTLRVLGGDEKGSLESETVNHGHESHGSRTRKCLRWQGPGAIVNDRPVLSSERERPTSTNQQLSDSNKILVVSPRWVLYSKQTGRLIVGRNMTLTLSTINQSWMRSQQQKVSHTEEKTLVV
jgi:hypothetical protein